MTNGTIKIIKASAGSGKTYNLARTYIANLIGIPTGNKVTVDGKDYDQFTLRKMLNYHRHLLAITFTNKATNEMKERIIRELYLLSKSKGDYVHDFDIMFVNCTFHEVVAAAGKALSAILFDYANFNVSTIDSFFQRVLRNFARELDHDYNYELQLDQDYATEVAVHDFLLELGSTNSKHTAINNWVRDFIRNNISNNKDWNFFGKSDDLKAFAGNIYKEFFREHQDEIVKYLEDIGNGEVLSKVERFKKQIILARNSHQKGFSESIEKYHDFFTSRGLNESDLSRKTVLNKFYNGTFIRFVSSEEKTLRNYAAFPDVLTNKIIKKASRSKLGTADDEAFHQLVKETIYHYDMYLIYDSILKNIWNLGLLGKINEKLEQYRKDTNSLLIADTNDLIGKVLLSGAYFIYEHVGTQFNNYMIDEFQDTSKKQYSNFLPLLEESIARGNDNLIIGDEKQSIYRFRNSDPSLLRDEIEHDFAGRVGISSLDTNYRSFKAIVEFNNELFTAMVDDMKQTATFPLLIKTYNNITQKVYKSNNQGRVEVNFVPKVNSESQSRAAIIKTLPGLINSMLDRGYRMGDIAILVNMKEHGKEVIAEIMRYNESLRAGSIMRPINVISSESLMLENSPSVKLILSALRFLELTQYQVPEDSRETMSEEFAKFIDKRIAEQRYYKILHAFIVQYQKQGVMALPGEILHSCLEQDRSETNALSAIEKLKKYVNITDELMPDKGAQLSNLVNVVDKIIAKYLLTENNSELESSYLLAFVDVVHAFSRRTNGGTIAEFLQYWDTMSDKLTLGSSGSIDAVNVMTIHKSKGLEFKCVIIPFANWKLDKMDDVFWIDRKHFVKNLNVMTAIKDIDENIVPPLVPIEMSKLQTTGLFSDIFDSEQEKSMIDNINKLYVALTRPKEELHVFACINTNADPTGQSPVVDFTTSSNLLLKFLPHLTINGEKMSMIERDLNTSYASKEDDVHDDAEGSNKLHTFTYCLGETRDASADERETSHVIPVEDYWVSQDVLPVHVSMPGTNGTLRDEGLKMHSIFSMISSERDFDRVFNYARNHDLLSDNVYWTEERVSLLFNSIKGNTRLMEWFDNENICYNERNISFPTEAGDIDHRRPDRIIKRSSGEMFIVDYKFGRNFTKETIAEHSSQVREYLHLMTQLGETDVKGYVWYTRSGKIVEVEL